MAFLEVTFLGDTIDIVLKATLHDLLAYRLYRPTIYISNKGNSASCEGNMIHDGVRLCLAGNSEWPILVVFF